MVNVISIVQKKFLKIKLGGWGEQLDRIWTLGRHIHSRGVSGHLS